MVNGAEYRSQWSAKRIADGLCAKCNGAPIEPGKRSCRPCLDKANERMKAYHKERFATDPEYRDWYRAKSRKSGAKRRSDPEVRAKLWAKARQFAKDRRDFIQAIKVEKGCADCGYNAHPEALDFDHMDASQKKDIVSRIKTLSLNALIAEIEKCEVVCANCHRVRTYERRQAAKHGGVA